jgi:hypothetical protein
MIASRGRCLWPLFTAAAVLGLCLAGPGRADEKGKGKKDEAKKPDVVQIDLSKLPPDLAAQLRKLAVDAKKPDKPEVKGQQTGKKVTEADLPPGLRNKPADHPGRKAFLEGKKTESKPAPGAKAPMTGTKGDQDLARRLRQLSDDLRKLADDLEGKKPSPPEKKKGEDEKKKKGDEDEKGKKKDKEEDEKGNKKKDKDD